MNELQLATGNYFLERLPKTEKGDLRAWDAADELLIHTLFEDSNTKHRSHLNGTLENPQNPILIINDSFGVLACALHQTPRHSWGDSYLSHLAARDNLNKNALNQDNYQEIHSSEDLKQNYDLVIIKIPKTLGLLEDQLARLKPHINADTIIIASAMSKHIHTSTLKIFEKYIGTTTTSRATKKARLIFTKNDNENSHPSPFPKTIRDNTLALNLINYANVFAKDKLDIGARFMLDQLKNCPNATHIVDLGCGNGVLGTMAQRLQPQAHISFLDESYAAVKSAHESYLLQSSLVEDSSSDNELFKNQDESNVSFYVSDCFNQFDAAPRYGKKTNKKIDLILCNPPFHQNHSIGDHIAWQMLKQSQERLEKDGEIWVVGNRHLGYHTKLKKLFGNCKTISSNKKFVVLASTKTTI